MVTEDRWYKNMEVKLIQDGEYNIWGDIGYAGQWGQLQKMCVMVDKVEA